MSIITNTYGARSNGNFKNNDQNLPQARKSYKYNTNLLLYSGMDSTTGWSGSNGGILSTDEPSYLPSGANGCIKGTVNTGQSNCYIVQSVELELSTTYTATFYAYVPSSIAAGNVRIYIWYNSGGWIGLSSLVISERDEWVQKSLTFTSNSTEATHVIGIGLGGESPSAFMYATLGQLNVGDESFAFFENEATKGTDTSDEKYKILVNNKTYDGNWNFNTDEYLDETVNGRNEYILSSSPTFDTYKGSVYNRQFSAWEKNSRTYPEILGDYIDLSDSWWSRIGSTRTTGHSSPVSDNAIRLIEDSGLSTHAIYRFDFYVAEDTKYKFSVYVKDVDRRYVYLQCMGQSNSPTLTYDLQKEILTSEIGISENSVIKLKDGWFRIEIVANTGEGNAGVAMYLKNSPTGSTSYQGDGSSSLYLDYPSIKKVDEYDSLNININDTEYIYSTDVDIYDESGNITDVKYISEPDDTDVNKDYEIGCVFNNNNYVEVNTYSPILVSTPLGKVGSKQEFIINNTSTEDITDVKCQIMIPPYDQAVVDIEDYGYIGSNPFLRYDDSIFFSYLELSSDGEEWKRSIDYGVNATDLINGNSIPNLPLNILHGVDTETEFLASFNAWYDKRSITLDNVTAGNSGSFYLRTNLPANYSETNCMAVVRVSFKVSGETVLKYVPVFYESASSRGRVIDYNPDKNQVYYEIKYYDNVFDTTIQTPFDIDTFDLNLGINTTGSTLTVNHIRDFEDIGEIEGDSGIAVFAKKGSKNVTDDDIIYAGNIISINQSDSDSLSTSIQAVDGIHELNTSIVDYVYIERTVKEIVEHMIDTFYAGENVIYTSDSIGDINTKVEEQIINYIAFSGDTISKALDELAKNVAANFWLEPQVIDGRIKQVLYFKNPSTEIGKVYYRNNDITGFKKTEDTSKLYNMITLNGGDVIEKVEGKSTFYDVVIYSKDAYTIQTEFPIVPDSDENELYLLPQFTDATPKSITYNSITYAGIETDSVPNYAITQGDGIYSDWKFIIANGTNAGVRGSISYSLNNSDSGSVTSGKLFIGLDYEEEFSGTIDTSDQFWIYPDDIRTTKKTLTSGLTNMGKNMFDDDVEKVFKGNQIIFPEVLPNIGLTTAGATKFDYGGAIITYRAKWTDERGVQLVRRGKIQESIDRYGLREKVLNESSVVSYSGADLIILSELENSAFPTKSYEFDVPYGDLDLERNMIVNVRGFYVNDLRDKSYYNTSNADESDTTWQSEINEDAQLKYPVYAIKHSFSKNGVKTHVNINNEEPKFEDTLKELFRKIRNESNEYNPLDFWNEINDKIQSPKDIYSDRHSEVGVDYGLLLTKYSSGGEITQEVSV